MTESLEPTKRFSNRVEAYVKYRPSYPPELIDTLQRVAGLRPGLVVADLGSGTGILSRMLLGAGCTVYGVEPNREMKAAAERLLAGLAGFHSVDGRAEATGLRARSVDLAVAGQAFHWFDVASTARELRRILVPSGWVALIWNHRLDDTPFLAGYEELLLGLGGDYAEVASRYAEPTALEALFGRDGWRYEELSNVQVLGYAGLEGRLLSSSYAPAAGHPGHRPMLEALRDLFEAHQAEGRVRLEYATKVFLGRLAKEDGGGEPPPGPTELAADR